MHGRAGLLLERPCSIASLPSIAPSFRCNRPLSARSSCLPASSSQRSAFCLYSAASADSNARSSILKRMRLEIVQGQVRSAYRGGSLFSFACKSMRVL